MRGKACDFTDAVEQTQGTAMLLLSRDCASPLCEWRNRVRGREGNQTHRVEHIRSHL